MGYNSSAGILSQKKQTPSSPSRRLLTQRVRSLMFVTTSLASPSLSDLATLEPCPYAPRIAREAKREFVFYNYSDSIAEEFEETLAALKNLNTSTGALVEVFRLGDLTNYRK